MSAQMIIAFTYIPFLILIAMSCLHEGKTERILKILSAITLILATIFYIIFLKKLF